MKKVIIAGICILSAAVLAGGGYGIYRLMQNNAEPVPVTKVSYLNSSWWDEEMPTSGIVTANISQEVDVSTDELISEVFVKEGDRVKIGDKLMAYDGTLMALDLESAELEVQILGLELKGLEKDLEKLKLITPVKDDDNARAASLLQNEIILSTVAQQTVEKSESEITAGVISVADEESETESETESESESKSESESESETEPSPTRKIKANKKLTYNTKPYKGTGTNEDPYVFFCKDGATIKASFINKILGFNADGTSRKKGGMNKDGKGCYALLEIREGDSVAGGFLKSISINGTSKGGKAYELGTTWTFTNEGITKNVTNINDPETDEDEDEYEDEDDGDEDDDILFGDEEDIYTEEELKALIKEKEEEIRDMKLDIKEAELKVQQAAREVDEAIVKATINGVVKSVGDPAVGQLDSTPFLVINSDEGMYVRGSISELDLDKVKIGTTIKGNAYESGVSFEATITEISEYPETGESFGWNNGNPNVSNYPFTAYIETPGKMYNNEYVDLTIESKSGASSSSIYLEKAYVRSENGQSYVFIADENDCLKKQYIITGQTLYSTTIEIKEGLTLEDRIAFPYGKNVKEGAQVKMDEDFMEGEDLIEDGDSMEDLDSMGEWDSTEDWDLMEEWESDEDILEENMDDFDYDESMDILEDDEEFIGESPDISGEEEETGFISMSIKISDLSTGSITGSMEKY